jgi:hypothetical protein
MQKLYDIIVFGATGFTGSLVAEYLAGLSTKESPRWALAGRDLAKLERLRTTLARPDLALVQADAQDPAALRALVSQARVVISTVGPYQIHGQTLVMACAEMGTDYVDLCGEPIWMAKMIPLLQAPAQASGARIVFSCGFDSIPFDLGVWYLQQEAQRLSGQPIATVHGRVRVLKGSASGGTLASAVATVADMGKNPRSRDTMLNAFALTPGFQGPRQPEGESAAFDDLAQSWTGPFVMAPINTKNVHRSNALLGHPWGRDFYYSERMLTGPGARGEKRAKALARSARLQGALLAFKPSRKLLQWLVLRKPGEGPSLEERESGRYELVFMGRTARGQTLKAVVTGDRDPGYGSTSKMIAQSALCLLRDVPHAGAHGGVWTPGALMAAPLVARLQQYAGLTFGVEPGGL